MQYEGITADIDSMMYSCGLEVLHPGGIAKTVEMVEQCGISSSSRVLDIGAGKGFTACFLAKKYNCKVYAVDLSEKMIAYAKKLALKKGVAYLVDFRKADACRLPYEDDFFDIVMAECVTVLLAKQKAYGEFLRVVRQGGYIADLEMMWKKDPGPLLKEKVKILWQGFETNTMDSWIGMFREMGLTNIKTDDFSDKLVSMEKDFVKNLGFTGLIKMCFILLTRKDLRSAFREYDKLFKEYGDYFGYGFYIGQKKSA